MQLLRRTMARTCTLDAQAFFVPLSRSSLRRASPAVFCVSVSVLFHFADAVKVSQLHIRQSTHRPFFAALHRIIQGLPPNRPRGNIRTVANFYLRALLRCQPILLCSGRLRVRARWRAVLFPCRAWPKLHVSRPFALQNSISVRFCCAIDGVGQGSIKFAKWSGWRCSAFVLAWTPQPSSPPHSPPTNTRCL
jgi:hypothetical protein